MKRITVFAGHYGSGKTNLSVNYAMLLRKSHNEVVVCDMDTVNPYFRTKDSERELADCGIRLISPQYANSNVDIPSLPSEVRYAFDSPNAYSVFDVGGDDSGAVALGQYSRKFEETGYDMLLVLNRCRYLTRLPDEALEIMRDIENASHLRFTGIVNNTNLGGETTAETVLSGREFSLEVSRLSGVPLVMTSYREDLNVALEPVDGFAFPIKIFRKPGWSIF